MEIRVWYGIRYGMAKYGYGKVRQRLFRKNRKLRNLLLIQSNNVQSTTKIPLGSLLREKPVPHLTILVQSVYPYLIILLLYHTLTSSSSYLTIPLPYTRIALLYEWGMNSNLRFDLYKEQKNMSGLRKLQYPESGNSRFLDSEKYLPKPEKFSA